MFTCEKCGVDFYSTEPDPCFCAKCDRECDLCGRIMEERFEVTAPRGGGILEICRRCYAELKRANIKHLRKK